MKSLDFGEEIDDDVTEDLMTLEDRMRKLNPKELLKNMFFAERTPVPETTDTEEEDDEDLSIFARQLKEIEL